MRHRIRSWLRAALRRGAMDRDMGEEMRQHLERAEERLVARGMSPADARAAARREFGNVTVLEEQGREARGVAWIDSVRGDLRYALRALRTSPAFAAVAMLSLAIGIGANTAIFSLIDAVMLKSLPVARPAELVRLRLVDSGATAASPGGTHFTNPMWEQLRDRTAPFATYAVSGTTRFNLAAGGERRSANGLWINGGFFSTLGVRPALGRLLTAADDERGCPATAVVSHGFWQRELGGRPDAVGRTISLESHPFTVVGVTPAGFFGVDVGENTDVYAPICSEPNIRGAGSALDNRTNWWLRVLARPTGGQSLAQFNARLQTTARAVLEASASTRFDAKRRANFIAGSFAATPAGNGISYLRTQYSKALVALMGMVGIILLISCANVANLLLARGAARSREIAIRIALGASRARLVRQFLTESALLAAGGACLGIALANWGSRFLVGMMGAGPGNLVALDLSLDLRVLGFTAAASVTTVALFGFAPAWRATRVDPQSAMKAGGRGTIEGHSRFHVGKTLVVAQCALALVVVVAAGLLVGTFRRLATMDPGFTSDGVLVAGFDFRHGNLQPAGYRVLQQQVLDQLRAIPSVRAASTMDMSPVSGAGWDDYVVVDGFTPARAEDHTVYFNQVGSDYFRTLGIQFVAGRDFGRDDAPASRPVAIVNRAMASRFFPGASPIGKVYRTEYQGQRSDPTMIVGVVENTKYFTMREDAVPIIYKPESQAPGGRGSASYVLSVNGPAVSVVPAVTTVAARMDPRISLSFRTLSDQVAQSLRRERVLAMLSGFFGSVALLLAMIGLYGVMAYTVARRRVEIGIRIALGAARSRVVGLVLGDVGRMIGAGIVIGAIVAAAATRILASFLFGVTARDPVTIVAAAVMLALAALVAAAIPARRAAALQPVEALRED
jgi:putative ABC transport system permease protein